MAIASLVLGILSLIVSFCAPFISIVFALIGLPLGIFEEKKSSVKVAGIILNILGLIMAGVIIIIFLLLSSASVFGDYYSVLKSF